MRTFLCRLAPRSFVRALCIAATTLGAMSCGSEGGEYSLLVRVDGAPSDTQALDVFFTLDGKPAPGSSVTQQLGYFGVKLPAGTTGKLEVNVGALGTDQCKSASGVVSIDLSAGRYQETTVTLGSLSPRLCSLYYQSTGEGDLSFDPPGKSCGVGCTDYPAGSAVTAFFSPTGKSFGAQVSLNTDAVCDGLSPCNFTLKKRTQLTASFNPRLCLPSKWCWYNPLPQGGQLSAFGGTGPSDIWAVGSSGTILHYDGKIWSTSPSGTSTALNGVWASSQSEAWAVGDQGLILHWDGSRWSPQTTGTSSNLISVWGSSSSDVWAVGTGGAGARYNGSMWTAIPNIAPQNLSRVSGTSANNVWAVGRAGTVTRFNGSSWTPVTVPSQMTTHWNDAWVSATGEVWTVGTTPMGMCVSARYDGTSWTAANGCTGDSWIWGSSPADIWSASVNLTSLSRTVMPDVQSFKPQPLYQTAAYPGRTVQAINALWGFSPAEVYVGTSSGNIFKRNADTQTTILAAPPSIGAGFWTLTGSGLPNDLFVAQQDGVVHRFDGRKLSTLPTAGGPASVYDAWAAPVPSGDLFITGVSGSIYRYSVANSTWSMRPAPGTPPLSALYGVNANELYAGSTTGILFRVDPTDFTRLNSTAFTSPVQSIWMRTSMDGWAVGGGGLIVRIMGSTATVLSAAGSVDLAALNGVPAPSQHLWIVGNGGFVSRYDGANWTAFPSGTTAALYGVAALSETDVWFVGTGGTLLHWDGTKISAVPSGTTATLRKIWGNAVTGLWLAGDNGVLMRYQP